MDPEAKLNWLTLATATDQDSRLLALNTASTIAPLIQAELLFWFAANPSFYWRRQIFELLDPDHQAQALTLETPLPLSNLEHENFALYNHSVDPVSTTVLLHLTAEGLDFKQYRVQFMKRYRDLKDCTPAEASAAWNALRDIP